MTVCESERLSLRHFVVADAPYLLRQLNEPAWLRYIGDRGVHTLTDAEDYIRTRILEPCQAQGYGMYLIELKRSGAPVGICGLVQRPWLARPDLGFALLEACCGQGYAIEAAAAVLEHAYGALGLPGLFAITDPDNTRSTSLLLKLGFHLQDPSFGIPDGDTVQLYAHKRPDTPV